MLQEKLVCTTPNKSDCLMLAEIEHPAPTLNRSQPGVVCHEIEKALFVNLHRCESVPFVDPALITTHEVYMRLVARFSPTRRQLPKGGRRMESDPHPRICPRSVDQLFVGGISAPILRFRPGCNHAAQLESCISKADGRQALRQECTTEMGEKCVIEECEAKPALRSCADSQEIPAPLTFANQWRNGERFLT